ncbi:MAG TPA: L-seryl-tRNA(Sec) selenium transferase, partial [Gemmatimonadales bacterium]|nr:L-seryl-tRNA(Sec) selenium transferase [Gemmatimonadales bacterium]
MDRLLQEPGISRLLDTLPRSVVVAAAREAVAVARRGRSDIPDDWAADVAERADRIGSRSLRSVLNATGVVLHTNLGRAPLARAAVEAVAAVASGYSALEFDLEAGVRGHRTDHGRRLLAELTGAEDALVVNNAAAALVVALNTVAAGREVVISRGELVEIGGSFRIPDILERSGARLREVGTTNRTHLDDYRRALGPDSGAILKVHRSNFAQTGFVHEPAAADLARLAREHGLPMLHDIGSGLVADLSRFGLTTEPRVPDAVADGADLVIFSGDKLLGGPQAGCLVGRAELLSRCRANPLARAARADKMTFAALEATLELYRDPNIALR